MWCIAMADAELAVVVMKFVFFGISAFVIQNCSVLIILEALPRNVSRMVSRNAQKVADIGLQIVLASVSPAVNGWSPKKRSQLPNIPSAEFSWELELP